MHKKSETPPLIVIVGETASGKSTLAMELAERYNGEIIAADSRTIYKGLDIGTAKPSRDDQMRVPHHLLDVVNPDEHFSAARFKELAEQAITDITARGKMPILVGGTGLYVDSVLFDYEFRPPVEPAERLRLQRMTIEELQAEITEKKFIMPENSQNKRHLTRLIEANGVQDTKKPMRENSLVIGMEMHRNNLRARVNVRVADMLEAGLQEEVSRLARTYGWDAEGMNGIGYREWQNISDTRNADDIAAEIIKDTLALAKRQRTWFKRNSSIHWISDRSKVVEIITTFLNKSN